MTREKPESAPSTSRQRVLDVALAAVDAGTFETLSLDAVRTQAGVSNGSLYYHFPSWPHLVDGTYATIIGAYQDGILEAIAPTRTAARALAALIRCHVLWCERQPERAKFLRRGRARVSRDAADAIHLGNARFVSAVVSQLRRGGASAELPDDLLVAFLVGPLDAYARGRVEGRAGTSPPQAIRILTEKLGALILGAPPPVTTKSPRRATGARR